MSVSLPTLKEAAPVILAEIKKAKSILLHCHPSPDPDSVCSVLAMKFALESLGKKVTAIRGDSEIPQAFMHFPGMAAIVPKNFFEVNLADFELFLSLDSGATQMISRIQPVVMPLSIPTIVIDHHESNSGYGDLNLIEKTTISTSQILFELFKEWGIALTPDIAHNLLMGIYTDSGGFKYKLVSPRTFAIAAELAPFATGFSAMISRMDNSETPASMRFCGLALSSIETFLNESVALASVSYKTLVDNNLIENGPTKHMVVSLMKNVGSWKIAGLLTEVSPNVIKCSFRNQETDNIDLSKLAVAIGGGGHKSAVGATLSMSLDEAKKLIVSKAKDLYNL